MTDEWNGDLMKQPNAWLRAVSVSVRGRIILYGYTKEAIAQFPAGSIDHEFASCRPLDGEMAQKISRLIATHGRHAFITKKFSDGTKRRYRGEREIS